MLDTRRRALLSLLAAIAGGQVALAGGKRVRIVPSCSLHPYRYTVRQPGDRVVGVSLPVLTLPLDPDAKPAGAQVADAGNRPRIFQLDHSELRKDHCALGDVVVTAFPDGNYVIEMTVSQSPDTVSAVERAVFERFARNRFHVNVRFSAGVPHRQVGGVVAVARPSMAQVDITPFWVEKRESRRLRLTGYSTILKERLDMVDHVEIDLSYE
jgi:hypothetical protein